MYKIRVTVKKYFAPIEKKNVGKNTQRCVLVMLFCLHADVKIHMKCLAKMDSEDTKMFIKQ